MRKKGFKSRLMILLIMSFATLPMSAQIRTFIYAHAETMWENNYRGTYTLILDIGQASKSGWKFNTLLDEKGNPKVFNSQMDALNELGSQGWEVITCGADKDGDVRNFYLKKETTGMTKEEIKTFLSQYCIRNTVKTKSKDE